MAEQEEVKKADSEIIRFIDDFYAPNMYLARFFRADIARGMVLSITLPDPLPQDIVCIFPSDLPGGSAVTVFENAVPLFAEGEVRYRGEPLFLYAGPDEGSLDFFKNLVRVEYEDLPPLVFDPYLPEQVAGERSLVRGNPEKAFAEAAIVLDETYETGTQLHNMSDPQGVMVYPEEKNLLVYASTQWPFHVRNAVAAALKVPKNTVIVRVPAMSPPLDGKIWYPSILAVTAAAAAVKAGKPVKFLLSREEMLRYCPRRSPVRITHKTALAGDGNLLALDIEVHVNAGAYPILSKQILERITVGAGGVYHCRNARIKGRIVTTSSAPMGAFAGLGLAQAFFAAEMQVLGVLSDSGREPLEWKTRNILKKGNALVTGSILKTTPPGEVLIKRVSDKSDFSRKWAAYQSLSGRSPVSTPGTARGIGLSVCFQGNGLLGKLEEIETFSAAITLDKKGSVTIASSAISGRSDMYATWRRLVASSMNLDEKLITIEPVDTSLVPDSGPSILSRNVTIVTRLIERCCSAIQKQRFRQPLPIEVKRSYNLPGSMNWTEESFTGFPFPSLSWAACVLELEVTGEDVFIRGIWFSADCGAVLNRERARGSVEAGIFQALEWCKVPGMTSNFPRAAVRREGEAPDPVWYFSHPSYLPLMDIEFLPGGKRSAPGGIGELPFNCVPAAYAQALSQALGRTISSIPAEDL